MVLKLWSGMLCWYTGCVISDVPGATPNGKQISLNFSSLISGFDSGDPSTALSTIKNLSDIFDLIPRVLALMLLVQLIVRFFFLDLYIVLSPLGLAAWALPGKAGQPLTRLWLSGFISTLMVQILQAAAIIISQMMLGYILTMVSTDLNNSIDVRTLASIMELVVLWFIFRIPALIGTAPMRSMVDIGQATTQVASTGLNMQMQGMQMAVSSYYAQQAEALAGEGMLMMGAAGGLALL